MTRRPSPFEGVLPNGLAARGNGDVFVSNLIRSEIYRVDASGSTSLWLEDDPLRGDPSIDRTAPFPEFDQIGGSGLQLIGSSLFASNTDLGRGALLRKKRPDAS